MTYGDEEAIKNFGKLLFKGKYKGIQFAVVNSHGWHPCGYVEVTGTKYDECENFNKLHGKARSNFWLKNRKKRNDAYRDFADVVHGGVTYSDGFCFGVYEPKFNDDRDRWFIGWDYGHYGDKIYDSLSFFGGDGKEWTTDDVIVECKKCIELLLAAKADS